MNVNLHIDCLVLDGFDLVRHDRAALESSVVAELTQRLSQEGIASAVERGDCARLSAGNIPLGAAIEPKALGRHIAGAVHGGLSSSR